MENLRTITYNDGTQIPRVTDTTEWELLTTPGYCFYGNTSNTKTIKKYGALYNWYTVDTRKLAPKGWHVPSDDDWKIVENYLSGNGYTWDGPTAENKIAKAMAAKTDWKRSPKTGAIGNDLTKNNKSGFSALGGGYRSGHGAFYDVGSSVYWWSATAIDASHAYSRYLLYDYDTLTRYSYYKSCGFSVRLVRD